jgi:MFS family permease
VAAIVEAYDGPQRTTAIVVQAAMTGIVAAFSLLFGGAVVSLMGWRAPYFMLLALLAVIMVLATRLPGLGKNNVTLDLPSIGLSAAGVVFTIIGVNQTSLWGLVAAYSSAPFNLFGISPALLLVVLGVVIVSLFLSRQQRLRSQDRNPLLSPEVIESKATIASLLVLFAANLIVAGIVYLLLLYSQMVLGYSAIRSAVYLLPMSLAAFFSGASAPLLTRRASPRRLIATAYVVTAAATLLLAGAVSNTWNAPIFWLAEMLIGGAIGVVFAVGSSVLIESAPAEISSEVGSARGVATFLGNALGIAIAGAVLSSVLASTADLLVDQHPELSLPETITLSPASVQFVSNERLEELLSRPPWDLTPAQLGEAVQINIQARLLSLRASLTVLSLLSFVALATIRALPSRSVAKRGLQGA